MTTTPKNHLTFIRSPASAPVRIFYCDIRDGYRDEPIARKLVWEGEIALPAWLDGAYGDPDLLLAEEVFAQFNRDSGREHPDLDRLKLRSLSVGDAVEIDDRVYKCAGCGFEPIDRVEWVPGRSRVAGL